MGEAPHPEPNNNKQIKSNFGGNTDDDDKEKKNVKKKITSIIKDIRHIDTLNKYRTLLKRNVLRTKISLG